MSDLSMLYDEITTLMQAPRVTRSRVESTLTDGYAHALGLEAERVRLQRRMRELLHGLSGAGDGVDELADVTQRLTAADEELSRLRGLLSTLRAHAFA